MATAELEALFESASSPLSAATVSEAQNAPPQYGDQPRPLDETKIEDAVIKQMRADRIVVLQLVCAERDPAVVGDSERVYVSVGRYIPCVQLVNFFLKKNDTHLHEAGRHYYRHPVVWFPSSGHADGTLLFKVVWSTIDEAAKNGILVHSVGCVALCRAVSV